MRFYLILMLCLLILPINAKQRKILDDQKDWNQITDCQYHLHWNHFYEFHLDLVEGEEYKFNIRCSEGRYFDCFILDEKGLHNYHRLINSGLGTLDPIILRKRYNELQFYFKPEFSGRFYLIVDNTVQPVGGHFRKKKMDFRFRMWELKHMTGRVSAVLLDGKRNFKYWYFEDYLNY